MQGKHIPNPVHDQACKEMVNEPPAHGTRKTEEQYKLFILQLIIIHHSGPLKES